MQPLGDLPGGSTASEACAITPDGKIVVGYGSSASGAEAFRWTASGGMQGLGDLAGGLFSSVALDVSADGAVAVGYGYPSDDYEAFIWDAVYGMRNLKKVLVDDYELNLSGWTLKEARSISADGRRIVGWGYDPAGNLEGWIATIPEPATLALVGLSGVGILLRRRALRT
jgi:uncharacterized membrane protein